MSGEELITVPRREWDRVAAEVQRLRDAVEAMERAKEPTGLAAGLRRFRARARSRREEG